MGAKTWMLVTADRDAREALVSKPPLDRDASRAYAESLFPNERLTPLDDGDLWSTCPADNELCVGCFPGVKVVAACEFGLDNPSRLPERFVSERGTTTLHAMHSVVDWSAFAHWIDGELVRSISLSPDDGVIEDLGERLDFERPYWDGEHPILDGDEPDPDYPLPFHPLEFGDAALLHFFGYQIEGYVEDNLFAPEDVPLRRFQRRSQSWWKFWS